MWCWKHNSTGEQSVLSKSVFLRLLFLFQGIYYSAIGLWAIVLPINFVAVTGRGGQLNLDMASFAALAFVIGIIFLKASCSLKEHPLIVWLFLGSALAVFVPELFFFSEIKNSLFFYDIFEEVVVAFLVLPYFLATLTPLETRLPSPPNEGKI
ncbi:MAG: hypothetical protein Q7R91_01850 [bacterium]|nr:hypothetical protein [bacterium]